jgi:hypothetical protein
MTTLIAALLLTSLALQEPDLSRKVDFEALAMPASRLVGELGSKVGLKLATSSQTAPDVVVLRATQTPVQEILDRVAEVVGGEWSKENDGTLRLIRPAAIANRELAQERQAKLATLHKELKQRNDARIAREKAAASGKDKEGEEAFAMAFGGGTHEKHLLTLLSRIPLADLVFTDPEARVVYSSNPTRMQRLLPGDLRPIVAELVAEHNRLAAANRREMEEEGLNEEMKAWVELAKSFGLDREAKPIEGRPAKLLLIASRSTMFGGLEVELRLYDQKGKVVLQDEMNFGMTEFLRMAQETMEGEAKPGGQPAADDAPIEYSKTTQEFNKLFQTLMAPTGRTPLTEETDAKLSRPDLYDPLSFAPSEALFAVSKKRQLNVAAMLPDNIVSFLEVFSGGSATVHGFLEGLKGEDSIQTETKGGWLIVRPAFPSETRRSRVDRMGLARLIGAAKRNGAATLDDVAAYAQTSPSPYEDSFAMMYLMLFAPNAVQQGMQGMVDWNSIRFYGLLTPNQKQTLADRGRILFGNLSPAQQELVRRMAFGSGSDLRIQDPNAKPKSEQGFMEMMVGFMGARGGSDHRQEPTEIMPNGLPASGFLTGSLSVEPAAKAVGNDPLTAFAALGADELAMFRFFKEDPNMSMMAGMMPTVDKVRLGERTTIELKFFVAPEVALERSLQDHRFPKDGPVVSINQLPADFQARIEQRLQAFKKSPFPNIPFGGGGVRPPQ